MKKSKRISKILSVMLMAALLLPTFAVTSFAADIETLTAYYYADGTEIAGATKATAVRNNQANAIRHNTTDVWGTANYDTDSDGVKNEIAVSETVNGNENIMAPSGGITAGKTVWWTKTAVFSDTNKSVKNDNSGTYKPGTSGAKVTVYANNMTPTSFDEGTYVFEAKVRFDDYNADRYIFAPGANKDGGNRLIIFGKGSDTGTNAGDVENIRVRIKENGSNVEKTILDEYTLGMWYTVKLVYTFTSSAETMSVYITNDSGEDVAKLENATSSQTFASNNFVNLHLMQVIPYKELETGKTEMYSNSYLYYAKMSTLTTVNTEILNVVFKSDAYPSDTTVARVGYGTKPNDRMGATLVLNADDKNFVHSGIIDENWDGYTKSTYVYMMQATTAGKEQYAYRPFDTKIFAEPSFDNAYIETRVRFDDTNAERYVLGMVKDSDARWGAGNNAHTVDFLSNGTIVATGKSGGGEYTRSIGTWTPGKWYTVKLDFHFGDNLYDVYINGVKKAENLYLTIDMNDIEEFIVLRQQASEAITTDDYAISFFEYIKAEYDIDSTFTSPESTPTTLTGFFKGGAVADTLSNGEYSVKLNVFNNEKNNSKDATYNVIVALYKGNELKAVNFEKIAAVYPTNCVFEVPVTVNMTEAGDYTLKAFLWDDGTLKPITKIAVPNAITGNN